MRIPFLFVALFCSSISLTGCSEKPTWTLFEKNGDETIFVIRKNAGQTESSTSVKHVYASPQAFTKPDGSQVSFHFREETLMLKCSDQTYATPDFSLHQMSDKGNALVVHWESASPEHTEWMAIGDASLAKRLMNASIIGCQS